MAEYLVQDTTLTAIADAVRAKKGTTEPIALTDFATEIESIQSGGGSGSNKLAFVAGTQYTNIFYDITASDLDGVTEIRSYAFYNCTSLASIDLPNVTSLGDYAFNNCRTLTSANMPNVTSVGENAFNYCIALASANMPNVTSVSNHAFYNCRALTSANMPNVKNVGTYAFQNCTALTSVFIGSACNSIASYALRCGSSTNRCTFTFLRTTPPSIQSNTFTSSYINKIIVPAGCGEAYKTATNWTNFADYIVEATE